MNKEQRDKHSRHIYNAIDSIRKAKESVWPMTEEDERLHALLDKAISELSKAARDDLAPSPPLIFDSDPDGEMLRLANKYYLTVQVGRLDGTVVVTSNLNDQIYESERWNSLEEINEAVRLAIRNAVDQYIAWRNQQRS